MNQRVVWRLLHGSEEERKGKLRNIEFEIDFAEERSGGGSVLIQLIAPLGRLQRLRQVLAQQMDAGQAVLDRRRIGIGPLHRLHEAQRLIGLPTGNEVVGLAKLEGERHRRWASGEKGLKQVSTPRAFDCQDKKIRPAEAGRTVNINP